MAQSFTDDWYAQANNAHTAFGQAENNDLALKSSFSGSSAPSNPVAGMLWLDTANGILKVRDVANAAWVSLYDVTNDRAYNLYRQVIAGTGLSGGGYLTADRTLSLASGGVDTTQLADGAVTQAKLSRVELGALNQVSVVAGSTYVECGYFYFLFATGMSTAEGIVRHKCTVGDDYSNVRFRVENLSGTTILTSDPVSAGSSVDWDAIPALDITSLSNGTGYVLVVENRGSGSEETSTLYAGTFWINRT